MNSIYTSVAQIAAALGLPENPSMDQVQSHEELNSREELFHLIQKLGIEGGKIDVAADLVASLEERIDLIEHKLKYIDEKQKPSVLLMTGTNPPVFENNSYTDELFSITAAKAYDAQTPEGAAEFNPDILIVVSQRYEEELGELAQLLLLPEWRNTPAAKQSRIYLVDGRRGFEGYSPAIADDIETLAEIIYPQYLTFGGNGDRWMQFEL
jgi:iron complex transport system substrate-binding protein